MKKYPILFVLVFLLTACGQYEGAAPTPTNISPVEIAGTMMQVQLAAEATQQAVQVQMTATAQVVGVTSTYEAYQVALAVTQQARQDAQATAEQKRLDIQATQQRIDADATAVQSRLDLQATQQAAGTATAFTITQTAIPPAATLTQIANQQEILLRNNEVQLSNLAVEQQRQKNTPEWVLPMLVVVVGLVAGSKYLYDHSRVREVKNDDGDVELLILNGKTGIRPRLMAGPVIELDDEISMPQLSAPAEQARVTERAQAVEAIKSMPTSTTPQAAQTFNKYFGRQQDDLPFDVIDAEDAPPAGLLDGETLKSLNKDWKEAQND